MKKTDDISYRIKVVHEWATERAKRSGQPGKYMLDFEDELNAALQGRDLLALPPIDLSDPVHVAAEIEALSAARAVWWWGTYRDKCIPGHRRERWSSYADVAS